MRKDTAANEWGDYRRGTVKVRTDKAMAVKKLSLKGCGIILCPVGRDSSTTIYRHRARGCHPHAYDGEVILETATKILDFDPIESSDEYDDDEVLEGNVDWDDTQHQEL